MLKTKYLMIELNDDDYLTCLQNNFDDPNLECS